MKTAKCAPMALLLLLLLAAAAVAAAQTVRGQLYRATASGVSYPAGYVAVTLFAPHMGRSAPAYSTPQGFYFLYNVPPGAYTLEIWARQQPLTVPVTVYNRPLTDIPPITIR